MTVKHAKGRWWEWWEEVEGVEQDFILSGVAKEGTGDRESWRDSRAPKMENMVTTNGEKYKMSKSDSGF